MASDAEGAARLAELGTQAVGRRVALRLEPVGSRATALCRAVAVLSEADLGQAAALAELPFAEALDIARQLIALEILRPLGPLPHESTSGSRLRLGFVHPLVQAAVYGGLSEIQRVAMHSRAARVLAEAGAAAEQVAAHLLRIAPGNDPATAQIMRRAAEEAFARGSPEAAVAYLERGLQEARGLPERAEVLVQLGALTQLVDMEKAADYLGTALSLTDHPVPRAIIAEMLGRALLFNGRTDEAIRTYLQSARSLPLGMKTCGRGWRPASSASGSPTRAATTSPNSTSAGWETCLWAKASAAACSTRRSRFRRR